ncbi:MAG: type II toxin-antitoxin system VapB family antitoxin [Gallionella sp.]|nr:type II toxin-antitoxin system VapB family antitoxin [Gallionella sp.]
MTTITLDDEVINEVIAVGHYRNAQEAVLKILADYVQQHKQTPSFFDQLRVSDDIADDELAVLFERDQDTGRNIEL